MSKIDELFNFEAAKSTKNQSKYSLDRSNAFYSMLTRSKRKIKCCDEKLIRVYSAGKMDCGNSQLGPFNEGLFFVKKICSYVKLKINTTNKQLSIFENKDTTLSTCMLWKLKRNSTNGIIHLSWLIGFWTLSFMSYYAKEFITRCSEFGDRRTASKN